MLDSENARKADLAAIHIAKAELQWDDDHYKDILWAVCRVRSSALLDHAGRKVFLQHLRKCGWRPGQGRKQISEHEMVAALWTDLHRLGYVDDPSESALSRWIERETGIASRKWLSLEQTRSVIARLKQWRVRDVKRAAALAERAFGLGRVATVGVRELAQQQFGSRVLTRTLAHRLIDWLEGLLRDA